MGWATDELPDESELPSALQASLERHRRHLAALVASLRAAGLDDGMIDHSVRALVDSYRLELTAALRATVGGAHD
jgi:hypothetical protein